MLSPDRRDTLPSTACNCPTMSYERKRKRKKPEGERDRMRRGTSEAACSEEQRRQVLPCHVLPISLVRARGDQQKVGAGVVFNAIASVAMQHLQKNQQNRFVQ